MARPRVYSDEFRERAAFIDAQTSSRRGRYRVRPREVPAIRGALLLGLAAIASVVVPVASAYGASTVQAAIDAARPGATVRVPAGTYTGEVVVDKDLTLVGAGVGRTTIKAPAALTPFAVHLPDGRALAAIVRVGHGAHVRMAGFTVSGPIPCRLEVTGVQVLEGASLDLVDSRVTGIQANPATCAPDDAAGRAVVYGLPPHIVMGGAHGSAAFGSITRVQVDHYQHAGISVTGPVDGPPSDVTVAGNTVAGGWTLPSFQIGVDVEEGAMARITNNTVTGNVCGGPTCGPDPISQAQGTGVLVLAVAGPVSVVSNVVAGNEVGVYQIFAAGCCAITGNRLDDNAFFGIVVLDGDGATAGNTIGGGQVGLAAVADAIDTTVRSRGDRISGTTVAPVQAIDCCEATARVLTT